MNHDQITRDSSACRLAGIFFLLTLLATAPRLSAQDQSAARDGEANWQRDLVAFDQLLKGFVAVARTPPADELRARIENGPEGEGEDLGSAGLLDFRPPKDTVQFRVNEALKGKAVRWELELADDPRDDGKIWLDPKWDSKAADGPLAKSDHAIQVIMFKRYPAILPATKLAAGQRIVVEGMIGDASKNRGFESLYGPTAFYHPQDIPLFFWVGLEQVKITRIDPTEKALRTHVLSGRANLDRGSWKVLEENGNAKFDEKLVGRAIDGSASTAWRTGGAEEDAKHPHSLLVDMGRTESVAGIRCLPHVIRRAAEPSGGVAGSISLYVSDSREEMGDPVGRGVFTNFGVEQEIGFAPVQGRYFKLVVHTAADGSSRTTLAELNLLAPDVPFVDYQSEQALPPMAEAIERFELLKDGLRVAPPSLELNAAQQRLWLRAHGTAGRRWNVSYDLIDEIADGKPAVRAALESAAKTKVSPIHDANLYAVAARPEFATEEQRAEMALTAKGMEVVRMDFVAALKRILSAAQQEKLKEFLADRKNLLPRPKPPEPAQPTPLGDDAPVVKAVLVRPTSQWRWLHPADGVDPAKADLDFHRTFFLPLFEDTSWQTDKDSEGTSGGFGYGDSWFEGVDIGKPKIDAEGKRQGYTAYFRHRFTTKKPHRNLELRCQRDDGVIVYLDGKEVARDNMSGGEEAYQLPAAGAVSGEAERTVYRIPITLEGDLPAGEHLLVISLHNPANVSSDLRIGGITLVEVEGE